MTVTPTTSTVGEAGKVTQSPSNVRSRRANPRAANPESFFGTWIRCFLVLFVLCTAWCLATPLGGAPDEPAQIVKAAATVRGEIIGQPVRGEHAATRSFRVPAVFKDRKSTRLNSSH